MSHELPLGKISSYCSIYTPSLLYPIPRKIKRDEISVPTPLPFVGGDIWNAYELSWLNPKGKPQIGLADFYFPCTSPNIIESKSFKLYLNSLNQTLFDSQQTLQTTLQKDLSTATGSQVRVNLFLPSQFKQMRFSEWSGICLDDLDIETHTYEVHPAFLNKGKHKVEEVLFSHLLKSNCLVTGQPDWGSIWIHYTGDQIDHAGLLKYLISFRNHNEFHEQCIERIFMDLLRHCQPEKLTVYGRYTRRGGLDINPFRSNFSTVAIPDNSRHYRQ